MFDIDWAKVGAALVAAAAACFALFGVLTHSYTYGKVFPAVVVIGITALLVGALFGIIHAHNKSDRTTIGAITVIGIILITTAFLVMLDLAELHGISIIPILWDSFAVAVFVVCIAFIGLYGYEEESEPAQH